MNQKFLCVKNSEARGFTLIELLVAVTIVIILASVAFVAYNKFRERALATKIASDFQELETALKLYRESERRYPSNSTNYGAPQNNDQRFIAQQIPNITAFVPQEYTLSLPGTLYVLDNDVASNGTLIARPATCNPAASSIASTGGLNGVNIILVSGTADLSPYGPLVDQILDDDGTAMCGRVRYESRQIVYTIE